MKKRYIYLIILILICVLWELFGNANSNVRMLISTPILSAKYLFYNLASLLKASLITLIESLIGLLVATVFSFVIMIIGFYKQRFLDFIMPAIIISQVIPVITLAPLIVLVFGIGIKAKIVISALMCFFPILVNFHNGIKAIPCDIINMLKVYNVTTKFKIKNVFFPLSTPNIMTGLKVSAVLSVIGAIVGEFNGAELGIGKNLFLAAKRIEPELMIASLLFSSLIGLLLFAIIMFLEKKLGKWYI